MLFFEEEKKVSTINGYFLVLGLDVRVRGKGGVSFSFVFF